MVSKSCNHYINVSVHLRKPHRDITVYEIGPQSIFRAVNTSVFKGITLMSPSQTLLFAHFW